MDLDREQFADLLGQMLETEQVGLRVFETALRCVEDGQLRRQWEASLEETREHVDIVTGVIEHFDLDPDADSPARQVVRHIGEALLHLMEMSLRNGRSGTTQRIAAECIVHVETRDHLNWEVLEEALRELGAEVSTGSSPRQPTGPRSSCHPSPHRARRRRLATRAGLGAADRPSHLTVVENRDTKPRGLPP